MKKYRPQEYIISALAILLLPLCLFAQSGDGPKSLSGGLDNLAEQISKDLSENQKRKIAVIEFVDIKGNVTDFGRYISEKLITRLFQTKKFTVVERQQLNKIISEQKLSLTGIIEPASAQKLGRLIGVDAIAAGSITDLTKSFDINARLISTETGEVFSAASVEILKDETVCNLMGGCGPLNGKTAAGSEIDVNKAQPNAIKPIRAVSKYFTFDLNSCARKNTSVICHLTVTNIDTDRIFTISGGAYTSNRAFDDANNEHRARSVQLSTRAWREWDSMTLLTDVPVNIFINFDGVDPKVSKFTIVQLVGSVDSPFDVKFRDVPITVK